MSSRDRERAEQLYALAWQELKELIGPAADRSSPEKRQAAAQLLLLLALYHEVRHGHDLLNQYATALTDHADALDKFRGALLDHADALSRYSRSY